MGLSDGLRIVKSDHDTLVMMALVSKYNKFVLYVDHDDNVAGIDWDDIVVNPITSLPKVISPRKVETIQNRLEKLPSFYSNLKSSTTDVDAGTCGLDSGSEDSDSDLDFIDSDYEIDDDDDDDIFIDNVDEEVLYQGVAKGKKIEKGKKARGNRLNQKRVDQTDEEISTDEEDLQLPDSDGEGTVKMGFKAFREVDLQNPSFKVGMLFGSVEVLRKAITEYSLKERVDIKLPRNEKKRLKAVCADRCPWNLYASNDTKSKGLVVVTP
jgi:hypothetical protein